MAADTRSADTPISAIKVDGVDDEDESSSSKSKSSEAAAGAGGGDKDDGGGGAKRGWLALDADGGGG